MEIYKDGACLYPIDEGRGISIVMASSEEYLPYTLVTINSLLRHASAKYYYDIVLLHRMPFSSYGICMIEKIFAQWDNCSLRMLCIGQTNSLYVRGHVSSMTYARLMLPNLLPHYNKVLYLDSDLVICRDISKLWEESMDDNTMLLGVADFDVIGQYYGKGIAMRYYIDHILKLPKPECYIQAGVLCMSLNAIRKKLGEYALANAGEKSKLRYFDQDVLNALCHTGIERLDCRWNVVSDCDSYRVSHIIRYAPKPFYQSYMESRKDPYIIHYSGYRKPWDYEQEDMAEYFHREVALAKLEDCVYNRGERPLHQSNLKKMLNLLIPRQSILREVLKTIYFYTQYQLQID